MAAADIRREDVKEHPRAEEWIELHQALGGPHWGVYPQGCSPDPITIKQAHTPLLSAEMSAHQPRVSDPTTMQLVPETAASGFCRVEQEHQKGKPEDKFH
jgi:hypothetical protein